MTYKKHIKKVEGKKNSEIFLFALSTCGWCARTKKLLNELGCAYEYVDVDLLNREDQKEVDDVLDKFEADGFPTIIINNSKVIQGFDEDKIRRILK